MTVTTGKEKKELLIKDIRSRSSSLTPIQIVDLVMPPRDLTIVGKPALLSDLNGPAAQGKMIRLEGTLAPSDRLLRVHSVEQLAG